MTKKLATALLLASACLPAAEAPLGPAALTVQSEGIADGRTSGRAERFWKLSVAGLAAANAMDIGSSWGKRELNGLLQSRDGTFGARGTTVKLSFQGALVGSEILLLRGDRRGAHHHLATLINLTAGAVIVGVAIRNSRVPRP